MKGVLRLTFLIMGVINCSFSKGAESWDLLVKKADSLSTSNFSKSVAFCDSILPFTNPKEPWRGVLTSIRGKAHYFKGNYDLAAKDYNEAIQLLQRGNFQRELGFAFIDQAKLYRKIKMFPQAIETYAKADKIFRTLKDENTLATVLNEWGVVYEFQNDFDKAIDFYSQSLKTRIKFNDSLGMAYSYSYMASAYLQKNDFKQAEELSIRSLQIFEKIKNQFGVAIQSSDIALMYESKKDFNKAISYLTLSDSIARSFNYKDLLSENYRRLSTIYAQLNDYKKALKLYQEHIIIKDSLYNSNTQKNIADLYVKYETAEKDNQLLQQENKNAKQQITILLIGSLLAIVSILTYYIYRSRKLKEEKLKLETQNTLQNDRLRISRDLHDNIGANLTYINNAVQSIPQEDNQIKNLQSLLNETIIELRRTVWLINKPSVKLDEWIVKLREYYLKVNEVKLSITIIENEESILTSKQATNLFRVIQEATNNAIKHSQASSVKVSIQSENNMLMIVIKDNGRGFDQNKASNGFGLSNMQLNIQEIGGEFSLETESGQGTKIRVKFPL